MRSARDAPTAARSTRTGSCSSGRSSSSPAADEGARARPVARSSARATSCTELKPMSSTCPHRRRSCSTADEVRAERRVDRRAAAATTGHDPVVRRRPLRPVEPRRDRDGARRRRPARRRPSAPTSGWSTSSAPTAVGGTTTCPTAPSRKPSSTPTCARTSPPVCGTTGCARGTAAFVDHLWPTVERAIDWVLSMRKPDGTMLWARTEDDARGTTRCSPARRSITHSLRCGAQPRRADQRAATRLGLRPRDAGRHGRRPSPRRSSPRIAGRWTGTTRC